MNYVVTLNIGNVLFDNSRKSMIDAAYRWGCGFHEITENWVQKPSIYFNKIVGIDELSKREKVEGVFYVDADTLIRNDTPNPFEVFPDRSKLYGVTDVLPISEQNIAQKIRLCFPLSKNWI